ncbi:MAG: ATP synthase F1 subunit epsilon [Deltaproteobacteria bacterium]|nr:ATP synthase F1 subunit epsilon [Deltaproteobacteria bacterium]
MAVAGPFHCEVITPFRKAASLDVIEVIAPAASGEVGILPGHTPFLAMLGSGPLRLREPGGKEHIFACHGGFLQVSEKGVVVLADKAESLDELDPVEIEKQRNELEHVLKSISFTSEDYARTVSNIEENRTRAHVARQKTH